MLYNNINNFINHQYLNFKMLEKHYHTKRIKPQKSKTNRTEIPSEIYKGMYIFNIFNIF